MERMTHVLMRITLDQEAQTIQVNDDGWLSLPTFASRAATQTTTIVKSETIMAPVGSHALDDKTIEKLPRGIVSARVFISRVRPSLWTRVRSCHLRRTAAPADERFAVFAQIISEENDGKTNLTSIAVPIAEVVRGRDRTFVRPGRHHHHHHHHGFRHWRAQFRRKVHRWVEPLLQSPLLLSLVAIKLGLLVAALFALVRHLSSNDDAQEGLIRLEDDDDMDEKH